MDIGMVLDASPQSVWALITDTDAWSSWGPSVSDVTSEDRYIRVGTRGVIRTALGFRVPFVITEFEHGRFWSWKVSGVRATGHRVEPIGHGRCRLLFSVPVWAVPYAIVCLLGLIRIKRQLKK